LKEAGLLNRKTNILHVSESSETGGAETVILNIVTGLDCGVFTSSVVLTEHGWLEDRLIETGLAPAILPSHHRFDLDLLRRLRAEVKKSRADLIHSHLPAANAYSALAGLVTGVPVVATYHGMVTLAGQPGRSERLQLFLVRKLARKVVAVSDSLKVQLAEMASFPPKKLTTIYNGVDWSRFDTDLDRAAVKAPLGIGPDEPVVGMVANLKAAKGYEYFIRAAAIVARTMPHARFLIIGEEEESLKEKLLVEIARANLQDKVSFLGYREDLADLLRILDVFVLSSISEGMSIVTVEAMGAGVPVVITRSGGPEELVEDGQTGFLVPIRDPESLAERTLTLLKNRPLAAEMADRARTYARRQFGLKTMIQRYQNTYRECLGKRGSGDD
jgi:glycosyltransferase involved in cell wall biosynthesis